ncbi:MAG: TIGR02301 family protein [Parvularculaceae bacterium]|nr:TIGR02301 family protein [Parvularculaceae bacterium]
MMRPLVLIAVLIAAAAIAASNAAAQENEWRDRQAALSGLARIYGELHHIRRMCEPRYEADVWRDRMKKLIELEEPSFDVREAMVKAFNAGYSTAQNRYSYCDRQAEDFAAARAAQGDAYIRSLTAPLYEAMRGDDAEGVTVWRGANTDNR